MILQMKLAGVIHLAASVCSAGQPLRKEMFPLSPGSDASSSLQGNLSLEVHLPKVGQTLAGIKQGTFGLHFTSFEAQECLPGPNTPQELPRVTLGKISIKTNFAPCCFLPLGFCFSYILLLITSSKSFASRPALHFISKFMLSGLIPLLIRSPLKEKSSIFGCWNML